MNERKQAKRDLKAADEELSTLPQNKRILKQLEKEHEERKKQAFRGQNYESGLSKQIMENFNTLQQIGYLEQRVMESDGIINFVGQFDSNGVGFQKRSRGRPKRIEVYYEDLINNDKMDDLLRFPENHGLTYD